MAVGIKVLTYNYYIKAVLSRCFGFFSQLKVLDHNDLKDMAMHVFAVKSLSEK